MVRRQKLRLTTQCAASLALPASDWTRQSDLWLVDDISFLVYAKRSNANDVEPLYTLRVIISQRNYQQTLFSLTMNAVAAALLLCCLWREGWRRFHGFVQFGLEQFAVDRLGGFTFRVTYHVLHVHLKQASNGGGGWQRGTRTLWCGVKRIWIKITPRNWGLVITRICLLQCDIFLWAYFLQMVH